MIPAVDVVCGILSNLFKRLTLLSFEGAKSEMK